MQKSRDSTELRPVILHGGVGEGADYLEILFKPQLCAPPPPVPQGCCDRKGSHKGHQLHLEGLESLKWKILPGHLHLVICPVLSSMLDRCLKIIAFAGTGNEVEKMVLIS